MSLSHSDRTLGSRLAENGIITHTDLQRATTRQSEVGGRLSDIFIDIGILSEKKLMAAVHKLYKLPIVDLTELTPDPEATAKIAPKTALTSAAFPYAIEDDQLIVAMIDPLSIEHRETIEDEADMDIQPVQATRAQIMWCIAQHYPELGLDSADPTATDALDRIGQRLIERGLITEGQLQTVLDIQANTGGLLGGILIQERLITEDQLYEVLADQIDVKYIKDLSRYKPDESVVSYLMRSDAVRLSAVPLEDGATYVTVAGSDPRKRAEIEAAIGKPIRLMLTTPRIINDAIADLYHDQMRMAERLVQTGAVSRDQLREAVQQKNSKGKDIGEIIVEMGFASEDEVDGAMQQQKVSGGSLEDTLVQSGKISPEMLARSLAAQLGYEYLDPISNKPDPNVVIHSNVQEDTARRYGVVPMRLQGEDLVVAMKDPRNVFALDDLRLITGRNIIPAVMPEKDIIRLIERSFSANGMSDLKSELDRRSVGRDAAEPEVNMDDNAIVKVVDNIIREAALQDVSDIHIEPTEHALKIRYRIDGVLREQPELPKQAMQSVLARIKIMGKLDIAERRIPQDGRVRFKKGSIDIDLRLSTLPTVYGEKAVMRLLQKASNIPEVEQLGFSDYNMRRYLDVVDRPNGIFLITGPTGSGKSFTSFSTLKRIAKPEKNTTTIEDPVEYEIPGIVQSQVNNAAGMTFAKALKAFLRQDPDIIFVGEIRDQETAGIAVEAALTGHLVLATLHTNDAPGAITRLEEMGLESFNISAAVAGVLAQRLVRRVCNECKQPTTADPEILRRLGMSADDLVDAQLVRGAGCPRCNNTGYKGRMGIHELMVVDDPLRRAINKGLPSAELKDIAVEQSGMKTLRQDGIEKAMQGFTTLEEVLAVTAN